MLQLVLFTEEKGFQSMMFTNEESVVKLEDMYKLLNCNMVELVRLDNNIDAWVDEEGLLKSNNPVHEFSIGGNEVSLAGRVLFLSSNDEGDTIGLTDEQVDWLLSVELSAQMIGRTA